MSVAAVGAAAFVPPVAPTATVGSTSATSSSAFSQGLDELQGMQNNVNDLTDQLATGQLSDLHTYTIAAAKDSLAVSLTAALRNKAVDAYQSIMSMQV